MELVLEVTRQAQLRGIADTVAMIESSLSEHYNRGSNGKASQPINLTARCVSG